MTRTIPTVVALSLLVVGFAVASTAVGAGGQSFEKTAETTQESPDETWNRTYDTGGSERFSSITPTDDGGYLLTGWVDDETIDGWVVKMDANGDVQWEHTVGDSGVDKLYAAVPTENGYTLAGRTDTADGPRGWLLTVSNGGEIERNRTLSDVNGALKAAADVEGGSLFAGWTSDGDARDGWVVRTNPTGETEWEKTYDAVDDGSNEDIQSIVAADGTFLFAGVSTSDDTSRGWAVLADESGEQTWERTYGDGSGSRFWAAASAKDGYVLAGENGGSQIGERDAWLVGIGADGQTRWEQSYGGEKYDWMDSVMRAEDGGYLLTGGTLTGDYGGADGFIVKASANGTAQWQTTIGSGGWDKPWPAVAAHDEGYLLAGETTGFDSNGKDGWVVRLGSSEAVDSTESPTSTTETSGEESDGSITQLPDETPGERAVPGRSLPGFTILVALAGLALGLGVHIFGRKRG